MKEVIKSIDITAKNLQEQIAKLELPEPVKDARVGHAVRELLGTHNSSRTIENFTAYRRKAREWRKVKAYTIGTSLSAGPTKDIFRFLGISPERFFVQDYLPEIPAAGKMIVVNQQGTDTFTLSTTVGEAVPKPQRTFTHYPSLFYVLNKVALTVVYSDEAITFLKDKLAEFLELQIGLGLEVSLSQQLALSLLNNSVVFNTTPYATSVTQANFVDLVNLMIHQEEETAVHETFTRRVPVDLVLLSIPAWQRLSVLKSTQGVRLYDSWEQAIMAPNMLGTPEVAVINSSSLSDTAIVARSSEWPVAIIDELKVFNDRIVESSADTNLYRFTMELYFAIPYTRRVGTTLQTTGYARRATISTAVSAINQP